MSCPFCEILNSRPNKILCEKKHCFVIMSDPRLMPGHLLVIPKRHVLKLYFLNDEERLEIFNTAIEYQEKIMKKISSGCDLRQNCRPFQKQDGLKIDHVHIHLQPRELFDELYRRSQIYEKDIFKTIEQGEVEAKKIFED